MQFKKPLFWDYKKPNLISNILLPLTIPIKINNFLINQRIKKKNSKIKTVCIGNIYLGGTGKTPTTISLYNILKKLNKNISTAKKFYTIQKDEHNLLKKTNLILGKTREEIISKAIYLKKKILIFDDGLQDKNINYDLKFVCFDSTKWVGNGRLIPSGPLREKLESLRKYDGIFLKGKKKESYRLIKLIKKTNPNIEIFNTKYEVLNSKIFNKKDKFLAFSGLGNADDFKKILIENKFKIIKEIIYPDHYQYKKKDIKEIKELAKKINAKIITSEKDFVKVKEFDNKNIKFLRIELKIKNQNKLFNFIKSKFYETN
jgi:tetraacyldisaccharide 4'-kinase